MEQVIVARDDKKGYAVIDSSCEVDSETLTYLLPTITSRKKPDINYIRKVYVPEKNKIIINFVWSDGLDPYNRPKAYVHSLIVDPEEYRRYTLLQLSSPFFDKDGNLLKTVTNPHARDKGGAGPSTANFLADKNIKIVIAGRFGTKMKNALKAANIQYLEKQGLIAGLGVEYYRIFYEDVIE